MTSVINDDLEIINLMNRVKSRRDKLWIWQSQTNRIVHFAVIRKVDPMKKLIEFVPVDQGQRFRFNGPKELFFFYGANSLATKLSIREYEDEFFVATLPKGLNIMDEDFLEKYKIVEMEDEKKYSHLRQAPRKTAQAGQSVGLDLPNKKGPEFFVLYDISQGGMGFVVEDPGEFQVGEKIVVSSIDGKILPRKINGEVVAVRKMEDEFSDSFKIGVKFV